MIILAILNRLNGYSPGAVTSNKCHKQLLRRILWMALLVLLLCQPLMAQGTSAFDDKQEMLNAQAASSTIDNLLMRYQYDAAYEGIQAFTKTYQLDKSSDLYLKVLAQRVALEYHYWLYDELLAHANELYALAEAPRHWRYRIDALEVFAYYDYYNYENYKAIVKYNDMQRYASQINADYVLPQYYYGLALLAIDEQKYDEAIGLVDQAMALKDKAYVKSHIYAPASTYGLKLKGEIERYKKEYKAAADWMQLAYDSVSDTDIERKASIGLTLAQYYLEADNLEGAEAVFKMALAHYKLSGSLFKEQVKEDALKRLEAQIAYKNGDYKTSADLFSELAAWQSNPESVDKTIAANEAASNFELAQIDKQMSLMDQLQVEQRERIALQQRNLVLAYLGIAVLILAIIGAVFAIRLQVKQRLKFFELSITDQLTKLFNRSKIIDEYERLNTGDFCLALMDLDRFKQINDTYGHQAGDHVLQVVSEVMRRSVRPQDQLGRYGGEEFLAIFKTDSLACAQEISERIRKNIEALEWPYPGLKTTLSIGLVHSYHHKGDFLLSEADSLLYLAKAEGRNQIQAQEI